jgi:hypothetical protein
MRIVFAGEKGGTGKTLLGKTLAAANALNTKINVRLPRGSGNISGSTRRNVSAIASDASREAQAAANTRNTIGVDQ